MDNWFAHSFRKVHMLYVSPQWVEGKGESFNAVEYADGLAAAGVDCLELYCKDHHGTCYYPCSLGIEYPRDILGELLPELKKRDIRLIAYVSICFDNYALGLHPEWRAVNNLGDPYKLGPFYMASICSPYMDFALQQIRELAESYEVDGFWLDIIPLAREVPQDVWMIAPHPIPDYSLHAQRSYKSATGKYLPNNPTEDEADEIFHFMTDQVDSFLNRAYETIRQYRPDALITYNAAGAPGDPIDSGDLTSIEGHAPHYSRQSFIARWAKSRSKPFEILTAGGLPRTEFGAGWNSFDQKPPTVLQLESAIAIAHGGSMVYGEAPHPSGATDPAQQAGFAQVFQPIRALEPSLVHPSGVGDIGLVLASKPRRASKLWGTMQYGAEAFHEAMLDSQIQYNLVQLDSDLSTYQGLVLADQAALSDAEVENLRSYVHQGGRLLVSGQSSLWNEKGRRRPDFALADVFGLSFAGDPVQEFTYLRLHDDNLRREVTALPILIDDAPLQISLNGATVLGDFHYPESRRTDATTILWGDAAPDETIQFPGLCQHPYGDGVCYYIPASLRALNMPNVWVKRLMAYLVMQCIDEPVLQTNAPPGVEVVLNRQEGRDVVHLINYHAGDVDRLSWSNHHLLLHNLEISMNRRKLNINTVKRVYAAPDSALEPAVTDDWLTIKVPPLAVHSVIVVESG